jgi:hypothetical protein
MGYRIQWLWLLLLGILPGLNAIGAEPVQPKEIRCFVCDTVYNTGTHYYFNHPTLKKRIDICATCKELKQHCSKCGMPVKETAEKTKDGRYYCAIDFPLVALDEEEIRKMFAAAAAELIRLSKGRMMLKNPTITVNVFDLDYWNSKTTPGEKSEPTMQRHGLSTSRPTGGGLVHTVLLHRGLWKDEMLAVCAHEYTHLWINENKPENRTIGPHTVEAVCEVVALALMEQLQMPVQVQSIMENTYTGGRIKPAAEFYKVHGLNRVLDWVVTGQEPEFNERDFQVTYRSPGAPEIWQPPAPVYRQQFNALQLKSVVGTKEKAVALINDRTFVRGEERKMDLGGKRLSVKLLEITDDSVVLQVEGSPAPLKLSRD